MLETIKFTVGFVLLMFIASLTTNYMMGGSKFDLAVGIGVMVASLFGFYKLCISPYINV